jgi:hypothetical protein
MVSGTNIIGASDPFLLHRSGASTGQSITRFKLSISPVGKVLRRVKGLWRSPVEFS